MGNPNAGDVRSQRQGLGANANDTRRVFRRLDSLWAHPVRFAVLRAPSLLFVFVFGVSSRRLVSRRRRGTTMSVPENLIGFRTNPASTRIYWRGLLDFRYNTA